MSPSRTRPQFVPSRPRSELFTAIAVSAGIVVGTALVIWLIRPGTAGVPGGGGLFNRQPRMTILVLLTAAVLAVVVTYLFRGRRRPRKISPARAAGIGSVVVIALGVLAGIFWPNGVIHHYPKAPKVSETPVTNPAVNPVTTPTTAPKKSATSPTTAKGGATTTVPASTAPTTGTTATTVAPTTTTKGA